MQYSNVRQRLAGKYRNAIARLTWRRTVSIRLTTPIISFTFDDFPRSALLKGGEILRRFGATGTYYTSLGLMGQHAPTGEMFLLEDIERAAEEGHELGCHTHDHCDSWETSPAAFEESLERNKQALSRLHPEASFQTFSYPISGPRISTKRKVAKRFLCCRGGGQTVNSGTADLNYLSAFFLEKSRDNVAVVKSLIEANRRLCGWLIFATHDISEHPTPWGCTPCFFQDVVASASESGATILPVYQACMKITGYEQTQL